MKRVSTGICCILLGSVLIAGGTFAKYTTSYSTSDTARVALFNFTSEGYEASKSIKLFSTSYNNNKIEASNSDKVVAPGASGRMTFGVEGTAETDCLIQISIDEQNSADIPIVYWIEDKRGKVYGFYSDIVNQMSISAADYSKMAGVSWTDVDVIGTDYVAVVGSLDDFRGTLSLAYLANENADIEFTIGWKWLYENDGGFTTISDKTTAINTNDTIDTLLGNNADGKEVEVTIGTSVTQVRGTELDSCPSWVVIGG